MSENVHGERSVSSLSIHYSNYYFTSKAIRDVNLGSGGNMARVGVVGREEAR